MLSVEIDKENGLAILEPAGSLTKNDFVSAAKVIDPYIDEAGRLNGLVVHSRTFPGWDSFAALCAHLGFIRGHHKLVSRVAFSTDSMAGNFAEAVASHFVSAEIKVFSYQELEQARDWVAGGSGACMSARKKHWENVYQGKDPLEVSWYQKEPVMTLRLIRNAGIDRNAPIIDVGGGASVLVDHLCDEGYTNLAVLDISARALGHAQERLGDRAVGIEWYAEDVVSFKPPHRFALWNDRAVFHFLTDESDRRNYIDVLKRSLEPNGHFIIGAFAIGGPEKCSGLDIVQYDAQKLIEVLGAGFELVEEGSETHVTPAGKSQAFAYFRFKRKP